MTMRFSLVLLFVFCVGFMGALTGCGKTEEETTSGGGAFVVEGQDDYDPHDVPITEQQKAELREQTAKFADAVATLKQFRNEVEQETAGGIPEKPFQAHQALDRADLVLQWLPEIARNSGIAKEHWETVNTSANELRTLFEQVHQNIDNKEDPNFAAVADAIDQNLAGLEAVPSP